MAGQYPLILFLCLLLGLLLSRKLNTAFGLPVPACLVTIGFVISEVWVALGNDTGIRADSFGELAGNIILPIIIMFAVGNTAAGTFKRNLFVLSTLTAPLFAIVVCATAAIVFYMIGHDVGFPIVSALIFALIACCTDNTASQLTPRQHATEPPRKEKLLELEAIGLDVISIIVLTVIFNIHRSMETEFSSILIVIAMQSLWLFLSVCLGWITPKLTKWLLQNQHSELGCLTGFLVSGLLAFAIGQWVLQGFGMVACAIAISKWRQITPRQLRRSTLQLFRPIFIYACASMFMLIGVVTTTSMFKERWLAMIFAILAVVSTRVVTLWVLSRASRFTSVVSSSKQALLIGLNSGRGAFAIALVFTLPESIAGWWTIQAMVFSVVLSHTFLQQPLVQLALSRPHNQQSKGSSNAEH